MNQNGKLSDLDYDKVKLLYKLSRVLHFIEKHAEADAKKVNDQEFHTILDNIEADIKKHITTLHKLLKK